MFFFLLLVRVGRHADAAGSRMWLSRLCAEPLDAVQAAEETALRSRSPTRNLGVEDCRCLSAGMLFSLCLFYTESVDAYPRVFAVEKEMEKGI